MPVVNATYVPKDFEVQQWQTVYTSKMLLQLARVVKCILAGNEYVTYICTIIQQCKSAEKALVFSKCPRFYRRE